MERAKRINIHLLNEELKDLINASSKIFPVDESYIENNTNPEGYEYVRILDGSLRNNIYIWRNDTQQWELIGADDSVIYFNEILEKPTSYPPSPHNHDERYYTKEESDAIISSLDLDVDNRFNHISSLLDEKVDKVEGKGLSTNDFTDELKNHLESLSDEAGVDYAEMLYQLEQHKNDSLVHTNPDEKDKWNTVEQKADKSYVDQQLSGKVDNPTFQGHIENSSVHVTQGKKDEWDRNKVTVGTVQPNVGMWYKVIG